MKVGDPLDRACDVGPMISEAADRAERWIRDVEGEARPHRIGGRREGRLVWPTVLTGTRPEMKVMARKCSRRWSRSSRYHDFDEALRARGDSPHGLQAGIYTRDIDKASASRAPPRHGRRADQRHPDLPRRPHALRRQLASGIGREGVRYAVEEMTNLRMVVINLRSVTAAGRARWRRAS